jgi:hypothetical protein
MLTPQFLLDFLPYTDTCNELGYPGDSRGSIQETFESEAEARSRMRALIDRGLVERIDLWRGFKERSAWIFLLAEWKESACNDEDCGDPVTQRQFDRLDYLNDQRKDERNE